MSRNFEELKEAFTEAELADIEAAAAEHHVTAMELLHDAVMNAIAA
jgi:hypothetical protein